MHYYFNFLAIGALLLNGTWPARANELEHNIPNCMTWLKEADSFYEECRRSSRSLERDFLPEGGAVTERDSHSAWFDTSGSYGHFTMGCVLRSDRTILFVGMYYGADPKIISKANSTEILSISNEGDVTLQNDKSTAILLPIQPFDTSVIKTIWSSVSDVSKNCQDPMIINNRIILPSYSTYIDLSHFDSDNFVEEGAFVTTASSSRYTEVFPSWLPRQVVYSFYNVFLIMSNGSILIKTNWYDQVCKNLDKAEHPRSSSLIIELCQFHGKEDR